MRWFRSSSFFCCGPTNLGKYCTTFSGLDIMQTFAPTSRSRSSNKQETNVLAVLRFDKPFERDSFRLKPFSSFQERTFDFRAGKNAILLSCRTCAPLCNVMARLLFNLTSEKDEKCGTKLSAWWDAIFRPYIRIKTVFYCLSNRTDRNVGLANRIRLCVLNNPLGRSCARVLARK